jgi:hypothetical protein
MISSGDTIGPRIRRESQTVKAMVYHYCNAHHRTPQLCDDCAELWEYARQRLEKCPFQETKTTCADCSIHCYRAEMRERVRVVMRYSGPRMLLKHPVLAIRHIIDGKRSAHPVRQPKAHGTKTI